MKLTTESSESLFSYTILISGKLPHTVSEILHKFLSTEQMWCERNHLSIHPQKFQHLHQYFMKLVQ